MCSGYAHFTEGEIEAERGEVSSPQVTQLEVAKLGFEPRLPDVPGPGLIITGLFFKMHSS